MRHARSVAPAKGMSGIAAATNPAPHVTLLRFDDLKDWKNDDHQVALDVFRATCGDLAGPDWAALCALSAQHTDARTFFERHFTPVLVQHGQPALFTGYYEPEISGSRSSTARFRYPLYRKPAELDAGAPWLTRTEIEETGILSGRGLEIVWLEDPVDVFFLQIQGSGRIRFPDGSGIRVGYGGANGQPYRSIGQELVRRGIFDADQVSAGMIRDWIGRHPEQGKDLLRHNRSFVFFKEANEVPDHMGPLGSMNRSVTPMRSLAVDPAFTPLGAPVWLEKDGPRSFRRLMVAQDTGSAIKGAQRADIFFGTGAQAGLEAGQVRDPGRMVVLLPNKQACAMASGE